MGMGPAGLSVITPGLVLVSWNSSAEHSLYQVYINGLLTGVTIHPKQRHLLVNYNHQHPALIELRTVESSQRCEDYGGELEGFGVDDGCHIQFRWPRLAWMPIGSEMWIYGSRGAGGVDYEDEPLARVRIWPDPYEKYGWGMDAFGEGDFGYSGTGAVGWGQGAFGEGDFGFDAEVGTWQSDVLAAGTWHWGAIVKSAEEKQLSVMAYETSISIDPMPQAQRLTIEDYEEEDNILKLCLA